MKNAIYYMFLRGSESGFESPSHRHILKKSLNESSGFFFACFLQGGFKPPQSLIAANTGWLRILLVLLF